jgi:4-amino-4-deoxy-L-arabinose transferase-like glycosyltransferase
MREYCLVLSLTPIVILEATTTQIDLRAAAVALAGIALFLAGNKFFTSISALALFVAIGIKVTALIPLVPILFIPSITQRLRRLLNPSFLVASLVGILINIPWLLRNYLQFGSVSGQPLPENYMNFSILKIALSPGLYVMRFLATIYSNLGQPGMGHFNSFIIQFMHPFERFSQEIDFPRSAYLPKLQDAAFGINEDLAPSSILIALYLVGSFYLLFNRQWKLFFLLSSPLLAFCLFVEWQPFANRFLLSGFAVISIFIGYIFQNIGKKWIWQTLRYSTLMSMVFGILFLSFSGDRGFLRQPILVENSSYQYFNQQPDLAKSYFDLSEFLKQKDMRRVNLRSSENSWEYPLWQMNPGVVFLKDIGGAQALLCIDTCGKPSQIQQSVPVSFGKTMRLYVFQK